MPLAIVVGIGVLAPLIQCQEHINLEIEIKLSASSVVQSVKFVVLLSATSTFEILFNGFKSDA